MCVSECISVFVHCALEWKNVYVKQREKRECESARVRVCVCVKHIERDKDAIFAALIRL